MIETTLSMIKIMEAVDGSRPLRILRPVNSEQLDNNYTLDAHCWRIHSGLQINWPMPIGRQQSNILPSLIGMWIGGLLVGCFAWI
jgi:hypothetical protein